MNPVACGRATRHGLLASGCVVPFPPLPARQCPEPPCLLPANAPSLHVGTIATKVTEGQLAACHHVGAPAAVPPTTLGVH